MYSGHVWLSYEDACSVIEKKKYAIEMKFAGMALKDLSRDDLKGDCLRRTLPDHGGQMDDNLEGAFPLLRIIAEKKEQSNPCKTPDGPLAARSVLQDPAPLHKSRSNLGGIPREDARCGFLFDDAECDPVYNCCSEYGFCGNDKEYCECDNCINYRLVITDKVRSDSRCGSEFPLEDGTPSQCDGCSSNFCCSKFGFCGSSNEHCSCPECVDYRSEEEKAEAESVESQVEWVEGKWRSDGSCGPKNPLPDGSGKPGECNPDSDFFCCSKWGHCGSTAEHCSCPKCVNYKPVE